MLKDPVCGMEVDEKTTEWTSTYKDSLYAFCSGSCKTTFEKDPESQQREQNKNNPTQEEASCCSHTSQQSEGCCTGAEMKEQASHSGCGCC